VVEADRSDLAVKKSGRQSGGTAIAQPIGGTLRVTTAVAGNYDEIIVKKNGKHVAEDVCIGKEKVEVFSSSLSVTSIIKLTHARGEIAVSIDKIVKKSPCKK
jgi:hypothetical protein